MTTIAMLCRYAEIRATPNWEVLARVANRCGPVELLSQTDATTSAAVSVPDPTPGYFTLVRVTETNSDFGEALRTFLYKGHDWTVALDSVTFRMVPLTADEWHAVRIPISVGYSSSFLPPPQVQTLSFSRSDGSAIPLRIEFSRMRLDAFESHVP